MKKSKLVLLLVFILFLSACDGGKSDYDSVSMELEKSTKELKTLKKELQDKKNENSILSNDLNDSKAQVDKLSKELEKIKTDFEPYKSLAAAEAESKLAKLEEEKKKKEEEAKKKEEEAKKAAEEKAAEEKRAAERKEKQGYDTGITYTKLARTPDKYIGEKVKFYGQIIQVMEGDTSSQYRFKVNDDYNKIMLIEISNELLDGRRILEEDYITVYGKSAGVITYESTMGGNITIPALSIDKYDAK